MSGRTVPSRRPQRATAGNAFGAAKAYADFQLSNGFPSFEPADDQATQLPATRVDLNKLKVQTLRKYTKQFEVQGVHPTSSKEDIAKAVTDHWNSVQITEEAVLQNLLKGSDARLSAAPADRHGAEAAANIVALPSSLTSREEHPYSHVHGLAGISQDELDESIEAAVQHAVEQEIETINQAVHTAFEAELESLNQTVEQAVETALLDRSFDIKANLNTAIALTGVILYWRGIWNLADSLLGTENLLANVGSVMLGLALSPQRSI
ncbi:hypothetical protein C2E20_7784 [Micractinium conductrix]|uniref:Histone deacetylase complex subunit SAP30 Sin3 binding domain-containing protein n=1 Tax=Micractinium conductrix TaxID=554055 RepID=A0A2P6V3E2_9CHLO|nr:hypothetical protein C2E20_7784 [Micractinium conductrix]|eukprot:PSC68611.1 hypothetical protein C2E20_7784 [Micractinium conductrix]